MEPQHPLGPSYVAIWVWLVALLFAGLAVAFLPLTKSTVLLLVFEVALVKAVLVARYYMHLRGEHPLIYAIAGIPVLLCIGMVLTLIPDIVFGK
jgi:caa(3)-type oxidase subunit IV